MRWKQLSRQPEADEKCWHHAARSRGKSHPHTNHCVNKNLNQFLWITGGLQDGLVGDSVGKVAPSFTVGPAISLQEHLGEKNTTKTDFCAIFLSSSLWTHLIHRNKCLQSYLQNTFSFEGTSMTAALVDCLFKHLRQRIDRLDWGGSWGQSLVSTGLKQNTETWVGER